MKPIYLSCGACDCKDCQHQEECKDGCSRCLKEALVTTFCTGRRRKVNYLTEKEIQKEQDPNLYPDYMPFRRRGF
ncbi:hypothetical protein ACP3TJ_02190 [Desulforudis sp. 1088]|uniref:hypothetical protein n=1 Tax=unclassified Candidatus Desulforudis TaxID=2635950 RepID=UPI003CE51DF6